MINRVTGAKEIIQKMRASKTTLDTGLSAGLKRGGLFLQNKSMKIVPVQLGNLKNSAFCRNVGGTGSKTDVIVGYTATYAAVVHEDLDKTHGEAFNIKHADEIATASGTHRGTAAGGMFKRGEEQQAKYLEKPAREHRKEILAIIYSELAR